MKSSWTDSSHVDDRGNKRRRSARNHLPAAMLLALLAGSSPSYGQEVDAAPVDSVGSVNVVSLASDTIPRAADVARSMLDSLGVTADSLRALRATRLSDPDVDLDFLGFLALEQVRRMQQMLRSLSRLLGQASADSVPGDSVRAVMRGYLEGHLDLIDQAFEATVQNFEETRRQRSTATAQQIGPLESQIGGIRAWADTLFRYEDWALAAADSLGLDVADRRAAADQVMLSFAENSIGRIQVAVAERDRIRDRIRVAERTKAPVSEIADLRLRLAAAETRIGAIADNIASVSDRLESRGFESAAYREALIRATGDVTGDVLNPQVFLRLARGYFADLWQSLRRNAGTVFVRILIVIAFIVFFRILFNLSWKLAQALRLVRGSRLVTDLIGRILRPVAILIGLFAGLSVVGVQTTTLLAGLGVAGLVVGFALQDSLSNLFAGVAILATRPYDVDDVVEAGGVVGMVRAMGLWNTTIVTFDARRLLVPNKNIWGSNVENRSAEINRRVESVARVGYDTDLQAAIGVLEQLLREDERVLEDPAPTIWVSRLAESWVELKLWPWVKTEDWWSMHSDLPRLVRLRLAEEGIRIPVPRRDVTTRPAEDGGSGETADQH